MVHPVEPEFLAEILYLVFSLRIPGLGLMILSFFENTDKLKIIFLKFF